MMPRRLKRRSWRGSEDISGRRHFFSLAIVGSVVFGACGFQRQESAETPNPEERPGDPASEIEAMLHASAGSWNGGDLDGFLDDYWRSENLTFSGETGVTRGWDDLRARYLERYWGPETTRDSLRFEELEVFELGADHALALGRYVLFRPPEEGAVTSTGFFSLVLGKIDGQWKILHDHTSAAPAENRPEGEGS
jgi:ketosteroid isomerase-like protein